MPLQEKFPRMSELPGSPWAQFTFDKPDSLKQETPHTELPNSPWAQFMRDSKGGKKSSSMASSSSASEAEAPKKTMLGDMKKRLFNDPEFWQHTKEDAWFGYEDNVMDAYKAGKISREELPEFLKRARERDKLLRMNFMPPFLGFGDFFVSQIDNRLIKGELSKPALMNRSNGVNDVKNK
jgi:hypothetical protein